jgi:hypothetical protein
MLMPLEVRFKLASSEYLYLQGLARFFYENRLVATPTIHSLAKLAVRKIANEWIQIQTTTLEKRNKREKVMVSLFPNYNILSPSAETAPLSQITASKQESKAFTKKTVGQEIALECEDPDLF